VNTLAYDGENRAVTNTANSQTSTYIYDGNGLRVEEALPGGATTVYVFSGAKVIAEYDNDRAPASPSREYIYAGSPADNDGGLLAYAPANSW